MKKVLILVISLLLVFDLGFMYHIVSSSKEDTKQEEKKKKKETVKEDTTSSFSFVGVGDNLIHGAIYYQQQLAGNGYDFNDVYTLTNGYTQNADLSFINGETICAPGYELSSYPVFNGPVEVLDAVNNAGFNWMALSSNHSMDMGSDGLISEIDYIKTNYPNIIITGSHASQEDSTNYRVVELNGIKVGLLGYTYGLNGYSLPEDMPWLVDLIDKDKIQQDMEAISAISDVQIVSMHWGTEYNTGVTDEQNDLANYLNELGAEVIIGTHPHVIEPVEIIHGSSQDTLVYYSLGNFLSAQDTNEGMVGGMASFTLNYDFTTKTTSFTDTKFIPTVTYLDPNFIEIKTTTISEYTDDMAANQYVTSLGYDVSKAWIQSYVQNVLGQPDGIEIVLN